MGRNEKQGGSEGSVPCAISAGIAAWQARTAALSSVARAQAGESPFLVSGAPAFCHRSVVVHPLAQREKPGAGCAG